MEPMSHTLFKRDRRVKVKIPVRLRGDGPDRDGFILDISEKGMLCSCPQPPERGAFIELITGSQSFVGHVKWAARNGRFGLVLQERIDIEAFEAGGQLRAASVRRNAPAAAGAIQGSTGGFGRAGTGSGTNAATGTRRNSGVGTPNPLPISEVEIPTTSAEDDKRAKMMVLIVVGGLLVVAVLVKLVIGLL